MHVFQSGLLIFSKSPSCLYDLPWSRSCAMYYLVLRVLNPRTFFFVLKNWQLLFIFWVFISCFFLFNIYWATDVWAAVAAAGVAPRKTHKLKLGKVMNFPFLIETLLIDMPSGSFDDKYHLWKWVGWFEIDQDVYWEIRSTR